MQQRRVVAPIPLNPFTPSSRSTLDVWLGLANSAFDIWTERSKLEAPDLPALLHSPKESTTVAYLEPLRKCLRP